MISRFISFGESIMATTASYQPRRRDSVTAPGLLPVMIFAGILGLLVAPIDGAADEDVQQAASERSELFEWFSSLDYPDVKDRPFVRVTAVNAKRQGSENSREPDRYGFLLSQTDQTFTVFLPHLETATFDKALTETEQGERFEFAVASLPQFAGAQLEAARAQEGYADFQWPHRHVRVSDRGNLYFLAWCCWRKGDGKLAADLYDEAAKNQRRDALQPPLKFKQGLASDLAMAEIWQTTLQCGDPKVPRERLLAAFVRIAGKFPETEYGDSAKAIALNLKRMVLEDKKHAASRNAGVPFEELSEHD